MTSRVFLTNVAYILGVMAVGALIETAVPLFAARPWRHARRSANLGLTGLSFVMSWLLSTLAAAMALRLRPAGLLSRFNWPLWSEIVAGVLVLDLSIGYLSHRTMHEWPVMWRFHKVHHSDTFVDVTTTYRTHPVETVWRFLFSIVPVWVLGLPAQAVVAHRLLQVTNGVMQHANVRLWGPLDRILSVAFVTPNVHKIHHSRDISETNSNYANLVTLFDRALGTYTPSSRAPEVVYGLKTAQRMETATFPGLLTMPFESPEAAGMSDRKVSIEAGSGR